MKARFSRKAKIYNKSSRVQKESAELLCKLIKNYKIDIYSAADLGSGTGYVAEQLLKLFPDLQIDCCDISEEMLATIQEKPNLKNCSTNKSTIPPANSYSLITSNFSMQWFSDLENTFKECMKKLDQDGIMAFSLPVSGTFDHLHKAAEMSNLAIQLPNLPSESHIKDIIKDYTCLSCKCFELTESFRNTLEFLRGVHNLGAIEEGSVTPAKDLKKLIACHDKLFNGPVRAKYIVLQVVLKNV